MTHQGTGADRPSSACTRVVTWARDSLCQARIQQWLLKFTFASILSWRLKHAQNTLSNALKYAEAAYRVCGEVHIRRVDFVGQRCHPSNHFGGDGELSRLPVLDLLKTHVTVNIVTQ